MGTIMMAIVLEVRVELPVQTAITPIPFKMLGATKHFENRMPYITVYRFRRSA